MSAHRGAQDLDAMTIYLLGDAPPTLPARPGWRWC
jgi:hypothetical protein